MEGVVLETYGSGNAPDNRQDLLDELATAIKSRNVIMINCTQCLRGTVSASYATGKVRHVMQNKRNGGTVQLRGELRINRKSRFPMTSQVLTDAGLIAGGDMTPEAALSKLSYVLAKKELDLDAKKKVGVYSHMWYRFWKVF